VSTKVDAAVIGSGAAGSVMAYELARRGLKVVVLEAGPREDPTTFEHNELAMFPRVYKQGGLQTSKDHDAIFVQGAAVGGSTVINNAIWMRADLDRILPTWEAAGAPVPRAGIEAAYAELERALHVTKVQPDVANPGTDVWLAGMEAAGIPGGLLDNNRNQCIGCGWCNYGCRYNRKTSMLVTYVPWAEALGAEVLDRCADVRVVTRDGRATGVTAVREGVKIAYDADRVVVCAGAIGSSAVLLASGIDQGGTVGRNLHCLGGIFVTGETDQVVDGFDGIGLTCVAHAGEDFVIESYFAPPVAFALRLGGWFLSHFNRAARYRSFVDGGVMVGTDPRGGRVTLNRKGNVVIDLKLNETDVDRLRRGLKEMARIYFAGGARRVYPSTFRFMEVTHNDDLSLIDEMIQRPDDLLFGSAHPQGGNVMCEDPSRGVVGPDFRVHGMEGLYVSDTSVWPQNIWANCQATAMAVSHHAATHVAA
jgi:choline dehydrogenase-like flavoprotein